MTGSRKLVRSSDDTRIGHLLRKEARPCARNTDRVHRPTDEPWTLPTEGTGSPSDWNGLADILPPTIILAGPVVQCDFAEPNFDVDRSGQLPIPRP